jgi:glutaredoxin-like YruB-family protein
MKTISIYSTPTCHFCQVAKEYFKENNLSYTEYNVASDAERRAEMIKKSGQLGVPVIVIGNDIVVGFNQEKVKNLLGI